MSAAAKMLADSTQSDERLAAASRAKKSKRSKRERRSSSSPEARATRASSSSSSSDPRSDSDLDLEKELKPIGQYVRDRKELVEQVFRSLRGPALQRLLPQTLKGLAVEELKARCVSQAEGMSKKRILRLLAGADPALISSSGTEDESSEEEGEPGSRGPTRKMPKADSTSTTDHSPPGAHGPEGDDVNKQDTDANFEDPQSSSPSPPRQSEEGEEEEEGGDGKEDTPPQPPCPILAPSQAAQASRSKGDNSCETDSPRGDNSMQMEEAAVAEAGLGGEHNEMELLELEMRARAIKAMLRRHETKASSSSSNK